MCHTSDKLVPCVGHSACTFGIFRSMFANLCKVRRVAHLVDNERKFSFGQRTKLWQTIIMLRQFLIAHFAMVMVSGIYLPDTISPAEPVTLCPDNCFCSQTDMVVQCSFPNFNYPVLNLLPWQIKHLNIHGDKQFLHGNTIFLSVYNIFQNNDVANQNSLNVILQHLFELNITHIPIEKIGNDDFVSMFELHYLSLSYNNIKAIDTRAFQKLSKLESLNLDGNLVLTLSENVFKDLKNLKVLFLRNNNIKILKEDHLIGLENLQELYLEGNILVQIESCINIFANLVVLDVTKNAISYITNGTVEKLKTFGRVYLDNNPFQCSCAVIGLTEAVRYNNITFKGHPECAGPNSLHATRIVDLDIATLPCNSAQIKNISLAMDMLYHDNLVLDCTSEGDQPNPIYWVTPWEEIYAPVSAYVIFPYNLAEAKMEREFVGVNIQGLNSMIRVSPNGSLHIQTFRGYFAGEYTCVTKNPIGQSNKTVRISIHSSIRANYLSSLYIGAYASSALLGLGIVIGLTRVFVQKCIHSEHCNCCLCCQDELEVAVEKMKGDINNIEIVCSLADCQDDGYEFEPSHTPPDPPVNSPHSQMSPETSHTPDDETSDPVKGPSQLIWEQLLEVQSRLRFGAERRIERVRSQVKSITDTGSLKIRNFKDAGSIKIQSMKETGSHAASKVKKNVASGMVQVKYGVQSIKEFCGTSDMGPGTISVVSVSTNVDTTERIETIKIQTSV